MWGYRLGEDGQLRDNRPGVHPFDAFLSPDPTSKPFLSTFLTASGLSGATSVLGEGCFYRILTVPFYSWGCWGKVGGHYPKALELSNLAL